MAERLTTIHLFAARAKPRFDLFAAGVQQGPPLLPSRSSKPATRPCLRACGTFNGLSHFRAKAIVKSNIDLCEGLERERKRVEGGSLNKGQFGRLEEVVAVRDRRRGVELGEGRRSGSSAVALGEG
jgi:hypothetical protein